MDINERSKQLSIIAKESYDEYWGDDNVEERKMYISGYKNALDEISQVLLLDQQQKQELINSLLTYYGKN